jgi:hypothetical protein
MSSVNYVNGVGLFTTNDGTKATLVYRLIVVTTPGGSDASGTAIFESYTPVINVRNKLSRGKFTAVFLLQCFHAIGAERLVIE